jgi:hypothetical protein
MTDPVAPPPPGTDTPVPGDAAARAAAAGRAKALRRAAVQAPDALVPATAIETRAQERARMRRERAALGPAVVQTVANPGAGSPGGAALPPGMRPAIAASMPSRLVPPQWQPGPYGMVYGGAPYGQPVAADPAGWSPGPDPQTAHPQGPYPQHPSYAQPMPGQYPQHPGYAQPMPGPYPQHPGYARPMPGPYPQGPYWQGPYAPGGGSAPPMPVLLLPPRITWSGKQKRVALLSSWIGQTVMALATHLLTAFVLVVGFAFLLHLSGDSVADIEADSFTSIVALWTTPDRVWATAIIGALIGGMLLALGWVLSAFWARSAGLAKPHRSAWLAWLCTTAATGVFGVVYWPGALLFGVTGLFVSTSSSLTVGSMWSTLFGLLAMAVLLTGLVGMAFGWMFLTTARPRVDLRALAEAEEAAARARDEQELTQVALRGAPRSASAAGA